MLVVYGMCMCVCACECVCIPCCCCSVAKLCPTFCDPMDCSTSSSYVLYCVPEFAQIHVHWVSDAIWSSHSLLPLFSSCPPAVSESGSFPVSQVFTSGGQSIGASASALVLPMNIEDWFPLGLTGVISLQFKGLSRVFSSSAVWKHPFFGTQPSSESSSHTHPWLLEKQ